MSLDAGTGFAGYTIIRLLGAGGMGEVYLAQHPRLPRQDALKVLRTDVADDDFRERFIREADLAASLSHPNILTVHDRGEYDDQLWISAAYIDGTDAAQLLRDHYPHGMPVEEAAVIVTAIAGALDYAHDRGLLHRDVKPANILLSRPDKDGRRRIFLADFGIARPLGDTNGLTATNLTVGTVAYAAPEQLMGDDLDGRADQYALAATAYHLLTGSPVYENTNPVAVISRHLSAPPPALSERRGDLAPLDAVLNTALAKDPAGRFDSCSHFAREFNDRAGVESTRTYIPTAPPTVAAAAYRDPAATSTAAAPLSRSRRIALLAVVGVVAVVALTAIGIRFIGNDPDAVDSRTSPDNTSAANSAQANPRSSSPSVDNQAPAAAAINSEYNIEVSFTQVGDELNVRLRNPNTDVGLVRSPFELALLDDSGEVIATEGLSGLPGSAVSTIYQLPPGGEFGMNSLSVPPGKTVSSVELTITGKWLQWSTVNPPAITVSDAAVVGDSGSSGPSTTGRIEMNIGGPLNVVVIAFVKTPIGTVVSDASVACVQAGQRRAFETKSFDDVRGPYELDSVVAYPTSVEGAGPQYTPDC